MYSNYNLQLINSKILETSKSIRLKIEFIYSEDLLGEKLKHDLIQLYQEVFSEPPYNENFSYHEVYSIFKEICYAGGGIFTVSTSNLSETIGIFAFKPLSSEKSIIKLVINHIDVNNTVYYAECLVAKAWRRLGIAKNLNKLIFYVASLLNYKHILLRTNIYNYKQISLFTAFDGQILPNCLQIIKQARVNQNSQ